VAQLEVPAELLALAQIVQAKIAEACPDQDPLKMRSVTLLVGEAYLQAAALEKTINDFYRRPSSK
jgi:hypothetical protein